jgi:hypothetical protein
VAKDGGNRWRLEFNVRDIVQEEEAAESRSGTTAPAVTDVWPEAQVQEAGRLIRAVYSDGANEELSPRDLTKALEASLGAPRHEWPTGLCRRLWEFLAEVVEQRRRSPSHLSRWYNLAGYCLRPGFGDPLDRFRIDSLWKLMHAPTASGGRRAPEGGTQVWIMWRRVAGGLNAPLQYALYERLRPVVLPGKGKPTVKPGADELAEIWRLVSSLERLDAKHKEALGQALLKPLRRSPVPTYGWLALTRLGARVLLYGPLNTIVHPEVVQRWLDEVLPFQPGHESEKMGFAFCLSQLARRSGQRALDVDDSHRQRVLTVLRSLNIPPHWVQMVEEVTELEGEEQSQMFGEALPIGLRLLRPEE